MAGGVSLLRERHGFDNRFLATDFLEGLLATDVIQLFEPVEAVAGVTEHLAIL